MRKSDRKRVAVIAGDGVGPEVIAAAVGVLEATGARIGFAFHDAGDSCKAQQGAALPKATLRAARVSDAVLFGAVGDTAAEVILRLRKELGTFANVRPVRAFEGVKCLHKSADVLIIRENTECLYIGRERRVGDRAEATRSITGRASDRIARFAFERARAEGRKRVTAVHKANVLKVTDGLFLERVRAVAREYPDIGYEEALVDSTAMNLVMRPERYDVILTTNLFGDILSDLAAGLVGGLGLCPSANIGPRNGIFEPVHGTAPDIAGKGIANPTAAILSGAMMLDHLGMTGSARQVDAAVRQAIKTGMTTPDLGGPLTTAEMADAIIANLGSSTSRSVPSPLPRPRARSTPSISRRT
ncbi:MAG TPA: isocitrate/isopropylmalate dehydrogenase family protein [Thermoplasmata archaeon]|nr:isocitrate/isopropylmalate dehydrogenase family protein [Thermoplasmata archaeon]